ncbi:RlmE family RNA methyltransferase [Thermosulfuriphilus sp.]
MKKEKVRDFYFKKAKAEAYPARSVYKLKEAQGRFRFLCPGSRVLDLGCFPGSWLKYAAEVVGPKGMVVGVDLKQVTKVRGPNIQTLEKDIMDLSAVELLEKIGGTRYDVVLSDMAPNTIGHRATDHFRQIALARRALEIALEVLDPRGAFFVKVFEGEDFPDLLKDIKGLFSQTKVFKPRSSRSESRETYIFARKRRQR